MRVDKGWPVDEDTPVAERVEGAATVRNDEPVLTLRLSDWTGDSRTIQLTEDSAYETLDILLGFITQLHRTRREHPPRT